MTLFRVLSRPLSENPLPISVAGSVQAAAQVALGDWVSLRQPCCSPGVTLMSELYHSNQSDYDVEVMLDETKKFFEALRNTARSYRTIGQLAIGTSSSVLSVLAISRLWSGSQDSIPFPILVGIIILFVVYTILTGLSIFLISPVSIYHPFIRDWERMEKKIFAEPPRSIKLQLISDYLKAIETTENSLTRRKKSVYITCGLLWLFIVLTLALSIIPGLLINPINPG